MGGGLVVTSPDWDEPMEIELASVDDLEQAQTGYAVDPAGASLCGEKEGDWRPEWLVIGHEALCGDPIFVDLVTEGFPVYTAAHGLDFWDPDPVADDLLALLGYHHPRSAG